MSHNLNMAPYRLPGPNICATDFKPPSESSPQLSSAPSNPKKRRKTSNTSSNHLSLQAPPSPQDLLPPPLTGYGDTIVASNPFDDTPINILMTHPGLGHISMHGNGVNTHIHHHATPTRSLNPLNIGSINSMTNNNIQCAVPNHITSNRTSGMSPISGIASTHMGNMSPISNIGSSISPMSHMIGMPSIGASSSTHIGINSSLGTNTNRSIASPLNSGTIVSPINSTISLGSPLASTLGSPLGSGHLINNGHLGHSMHSPLGNNSNHNHAPSIRLNVSNGSMISTGGSLSHQISTIVGSNPNSPMTSSAHMGTTNCLNNINSSLVGSIAPPSSLTHQNVTLTQGGQNTNMAHIISSGGMNSTHFHTHVGQTNSSSSVSCGGSINGLQNSIGMFGAKALPISAGKIYPPDQPMVFNPQNPNAPPIYPCGLCHKEVNDNDEALFCDSECNFFFHRACSGLTELAFQFISKEVYAEWCCDKCFSSKNIPFVKFKC